MNNKEEKEILEHLSLLEPTQADTPRPASQALAQVQARVREEQKMSWHYRFSKFISTSQGRFRLGAVLATLLLIVAFSFPSVRVTASELLSLFRVQNFAAVSISPEQLAVLEQVAESGIAPGEIVFLDEPGDVTKVDSLAEAEEAAGLDNIRTLPRLGPPNELFVVDGGTARLDIDLEGARSILEAVGADPMLLSDSLEGESVHTTIPAGVEQVWYDEVSFYQSESPLVEYPDGLNAAPLGEALLRVLGLSEDEAARLAQEIDWTSTLLLPIPTEFATFNEVPINGASGIAITSLDGSGSAVVWQENGVLYMLSGETLSVEELLSFTTSIR